MAEKQEGAKPRKKAENPHAGKRAVFVSHEGSENGFELLGIYEGEPKDAKRAALRDHPDVKERLNKGGVKLAAPPASGWVTTLKEVEPPDPEDYKGL